ncbi:DEBR0S4_12420g1_1 [Brettanomyces bruxellensis]|uniref:DEBR0S4_12420g1_1 n=1 Tax=Dekkera bruxellensis TaxID=5007 RepID=A0A7D9CZY3_DEKBR|nr:DEBR0S4_12420g1_1 [Brettanomyces bruxellensis]
MFVWGGVRSRRLMLNFGSRYHISDEISVSKCSFANMVGGGKGRVKEYISRLENTEEQASRKVKIPNRSLPEKQINQPRAYKTPFIQFGYGDYLEAALSTQDSSKLDKYRDYINVKSGRNKLNRLNNGGLIEMMMNYNSTSKVKLTELKFTAAAQTQIKLPPDILDSIACELGNVAGDSSEINAIFEKYESQLTKFSLIHRIIALLNTASELSEPSNAFTAITSYSVERFELLERVDIEKVVSLLLYYKQLLLVQKTIKSFDDGDDNGQSFIECASPELKLRLLDSFIKSGKFQEASDIVESLKDVDKMVPQRELTNRYVALVSSIAKALKSTWQNRKLFFNAYTRSIAPIMRQSEILNSELVNIILEWIDDSEIDWFITFLNTCPHHVSSISACADQFISRYAASLTKGVDDDITKSIHLTSFIKKLGIPRSNFTSEVKYQIAKLYASFGSPAATNLWYDKKKMTPNEICEIAELLKSALKRKKNNSLPGQSPQDIKAYLDMIYSKS